MWIKKLALFALGFSFFTTAQANVVITGTRVIYPAEKKMISVELENKDARPSLIQAWIDNGNPNIHPNAVKVPFSITPPITRVEARSRHSLRIRYTGEPLAQDRETLFYFNLLDVPPKPKQSEISSPNYMQITLRSRLKFFFRPANLPYSANDAYTKVTWQLTGKTIKVHNPTPYFITYADIALKQDKKITNQISQSGMVAPFSDKTFPLKKSASGNEVVWSVINDFGGNTQGTSPLMR